MHLKTSVNATLGVVIPTIGDRLELNRLLHSVLGQSRLPDVVCIVVDAYDTSFVEEVVAGIGDLGQKIPIDITSTGARRVEGAYLAETGYGVAVNTGLARLDTDLIAILDDDDEILPSHFAQLSAALDPAAGRGIAYSRVLVISPDGSRRSYQEGQLPEGKIPTSVLIGRHPVLLPATLIHRSVLDAAGRLDEDLDRKADTDMLIRLGAASEFAAVSDATYLYYRNPSGADVHDRALIERAKLLRKYEYKMSNFERWLLWDGLVRSSLRHNAPDLAREAATEALSIALPTPWAPVVELYVWLRRMKAPNLVKSIFRRTTRAVDTDHGYSD